MARRISGLIIADEQPDYSDSDADNFFDRMVNSDRFHFFCQINDAGDVTTYGKNHPLRCYVLSAKTDLKSNSIFLTIDTRYENTIPYGIQRGIFELLFNSYLICRRLPSEMFKKPK